MGWRGLLAELKLMQGTEVAAASAWGRTLVCRKLWVPVPRARRENFVKYLVEKSIKTKGRCYFYNKK